MIFTASVVTLTTNRYSFQFQPDVVIIDALQGPALFVIRVVRLRELYDSFGNDYFVANSTMCRLMHILKLISVCGQNMHLL